MSRGQLHDEAVEQRLRDALEARANSVDLESLRPGVPPTKSSRSFLPSRRTVVVLLGLAAAVASVLLAVHERDSNTPVRPADTPSISPSPSTRQPGPTPSAVVSPAPGAVTTSNTPDSVPTTFIEP
ncbi:MULTISPECIES: hypothetical protein [unclassified Streptomyces]|uniref:hypothetical protein n=1 Tax=unclassified Streptomyces TaxID=2593676 RepID=UPI0033D62E6F